MGRRRPALAMILFALAWLLPIQPAASQTLTRAEREAAIAEVKTLIRAHYVFADRREPVIARIEAARRAGRYDTDSPAMFAHRVSEDLRAASGDGHLYLRDSPGDFAAAGRPEAADDGLEARRRAEAARLRSGLAHLEILPGNVRYLRVTQFRWHPERTPLDYAEAARFLIDGDAVILDLRDNGGGSSDAADTFLRTLLPPDPLRADQPASRGRDPRWAGKPIYILISAGTGSAAEAVAYGAQLERVATIVGMASYGAANNTRYFPVAPRFVLSVSYNRPVHPISGTNWEGAGVQPDLPVSAERALAAAHADALAKLAARPEADAAARAGYAWTLIDVASRLDPPRSDPARRARDAGRYGTIELRDSPEGLRFFRSDRPKRPQGVVMRPLDANGLYAVDGYIDLRVQVTDGFIALLHGSMDAMERFERSPAS